jgi:hypothetical protein
MANNTLETAFTIPVTPAHDRRCRADRCIERAARCLMTNTAVEGEGVV